MKLNILERTSPYLIVLIIILLFLILGACTNKKGATDALLDSSYHPIEVGGYGWFDCGEDDWYATRFKAYNQDSSRIVTGCVCQGLFKGKTIRLD